MKKTTIALAAMSGLVAIVLAGCAGGSSDAGSEAVNGRGPITYVQGKDNNAVLAGIIDGWNNEHPDEEVTLKEQSDNPDQQHDDLVQNFQAENAHYDVVSVDVIWTPEFAAKGWLQPLEGDLAMDTSALLPATVATATYLGKQYSAPVTSDGGMLYYRTDLIDTPPTTWDELIADCDVAEQAGIDCYAGQFKQYEGLTVNVSEQINGADGSIVADDGLTPTLDTDAARDGLQQLVQAFKDGDIPQEALTFQEEQGRQAFEEGKLLFLRNWPYMYSLAKTDDTSVVKDSFDVAPLVSASTLGGHNAAISVYSKHKATAHDFLDYLQSDEVQKILMRQGSLAPVVAEIYDDPELIAENPYLPTLKQSILGAVPRPVTPFYPAVTQAIQENAFAALQGTVDVEAALANMQAAIETATSGN